MCSSDLESWWAAAPVDLHQVAVTDALVLTGTGQTGVTLGQHCGIDISWGNARKTGMSCVKILMLLTLHFCFQHSSLPVHSNFLAGVVSSSLPSMPRGPAQRAMPGSL